MAALLLRNQFVRKANALCALVHVQNKKPRVWTVLLNAGCI
jgi:hypothetical protein